MKAVVAHEPNKFAVEEVDLDGPKAGEVLVKMGATGVCHSDLSVINQTIPLPLPMVIGHEGAGVVDRVGEGVTTEKIAATMHISPKTVETYRARIKEKLGLSNMTELIHRATRWVTENA